MKFKIFYNADRWNSQFFHAWSIKFVIVPCLIDEIPNFFTHDWQNSLIFWNWLTKFMVFLSLIDEICNFSKPDSWNSWFFWAWSMKCEIFFFCAYVRQNSGFFFVWSTKFVIFLCSIGKLCTFSTLDWWNLHLFMPNQWYSRFLTDSYEICIFFYH